MAKIKTSYALCVHCGACTGVCKSNALYINKETAQTCFDAEKCTTCNGCIEACPRRAITV